MNHFTECLGGTALNSGGVLREEFGGSSVPDSRASKLKESGGIWSEISMLVK
jgi:hypothetical protein